MSQLYKLFIADLKMTFREKQVWFWSIFYPVLLMFIFLSIFSGDSDSESSFNAKIAVVAEQQNAFSQPFIMALNEIEVLDWEGDLSERSEAEALLKEKEIDAFIHIPDVQQDQSLELVLNTEKQNSVTAQALGHMLNSVITQMNFQQAGITPQISYETSYISAANDSIRYSDFLLTGLIALGIAQSGLFGMVSLVEMRRNGLLKRLMLTPISMKLFGISGIFVRIVLSIIQILLLTSIGILVYNASLDINLLSFGIIFIIGSLCFSAIGYFIAAVSKSMDSFFGISNLISFLMMFLSGVFFEYSLLPDWIKPIADYLPLTYFVNGIRDSMIYNISVTDSSVWFNSGILLVWSIVMFLIASKLFKWNAESKV